MSFGGGYRPPPDNSLHLERMRQEEAERNRAREAQERAEREALARERFTTGLASAQDRFRDMATQRLSRMGLDPERYGSLVESALMSGVNRVPDLDPNPGQYFSDSLLDDAINRKQQDRRMALMRDVDRAFDPNVVRNTFRDEDINPFIDQVLGRQRGEAINTLERAQRRGNLTDAGFNAALARLDEMERAGRSTAATLGGAVLDRKRGMLSEVADEARSRAGSFTLGNDFNLDDYRTRFEDRASNLRDRLEGDVLNTIGNQSFFNIGDLLTRGGVAQGPVNPRVALADILAQRERTRNSERGLGSRTGVF